MLSRLRLSRIAFAALAGLLLIWQPQAALAAVLSSRSVILQRSEPGLTSNQEIRFTTPSGVTVAGQTMVLHYPTGFDLTTLGVGDFDLFYGAVTGLETSATLAAAAGVGIWGVGVSGQNITFTAPTNVGPIPAGNKVVIRIGTNASGGVNRIVNPSGAGGVVYLVIDGSFGDTGGFDVPIIDDTSVAVTAVVGAGAPPVVPPGPGGGDGTPPNIFNVQVINITTSTARVIWQTDEVANGLVQYGLTNAYGMNGSHGNYITSHQIDLSSLTSSTLYHFRVFSTDSSGNIGSTGDLTFTTLSIPQAPVISNLQIIAITDSSAVVTWDTDIAANSLVDYGLTNAYGLSVNNAAYVTNHSLSLTGLSAATPYHLRVTSAEPTGLSSSSPDTTFTTLSDSTPPTNVFNFTATPGDSQNVLNWNNPPEPDFSFVRIRARTDGYPAGPSDGRLVYQGNAQNMTDTGLANGTTYFYANYAFDTAGNRSSGAFAQATPFGALPPVIPPVVPPVVPPVAPPAGPGGAPTTTPPTIPPPGAATTTPPIIPPVTATTTPPIPSGIAIQPQYYGGNGTVELVEDAQGQFGVMVGRSVLVRVPTVGLGRTPRSAMITVNGGRYALTPVGEGDVWAASFIPSNRVEKVSGSVEFVFEDGTTATSRSTINVQPGGRVSVREGISPVPQPKAGATVTLYEMTVSGWQIWNGSRFGQANPQITGANGGYGYVVRNGTYRVVVEAEGHEKQERTITVRANVVGIDVLLPRTLTLPIIGPIIEVIQSPPVQEAATVAVPVAAVVAVANLGLATSAFSILNYLYFLFTQPLLLLNRKTRERWGLVYNSLSKQPVDLVAVRLVHAKTNLILQTRISDAKGRFTFRVRPGEYRIQVSKQGYTFPSQYVKNQAEDGEFVDLYHGEVIKADEDATIAVNIPLDPQVKEETPAKIIWKQRLRHLQVFISFASVIVSIVALTIAPSWVLAGLLAFQLCTFLIFRRLAQPKKPKGWGIVYDHGTRRPLGKTVVRIFDRKFNKLLETQITDNHGSYGFYATKNVYFVTADKPGFEKYKSEDIDLTKKEVAVIDKHIDLKKSA